ncbi:aspartic peptidase domain-containing protein [Stachybotrys elegans]|uniref:Aspartic peptidase domain-containing protein n=1 Tax=Stachybotrys elegans TaxID=80388 RepID=A0A8K0WUG5_9HYPO|nr:aspartic peptidase domain-containing protein [Stachybotrys elegans]
MVSLAVDVQLTNTVNLPIYYQPLIDQQVVSNLSWGTPGGNPIPTVIDTGSYGFWLHGPNSTVNSGSPYLGVLGPCNQTAEPFFDWPASTSRDGPRAQGAAFAYGGGGKIVNCPSVINDTVTFDVEGFAALPNTEVALCDFMLIKDRATTCAGAHYDKSIMGLARSEGSAGPHFRDGLEANGLDNNDIYSLWFEKLPADINDPQHGTLMFGGAPTDKHIGDIAKVKQTKPDDGGTPGLYYVSLPEVQVAPIDGSGCPQTIEAVEPFSGVMPVCLVDTGTWGLTLPTNQTAFLEASGLALDSPFITLAYPTECKDIPADATIDLKFTGDDGKVATIKLPFRNLAQGPGQQPNTCSLNLQLEDPGCTFGGSFFSAALSIFNDADDTVSFAQIPL